MTTPLNKQIEEILKKLKKWEKEDSSFWYYLETDYKKSFEIAVRKTTEEFLSALKTKVEEIEKLKGVTKVVCPRCGSRLILDGLCVTYWWCENCKAKIEDKKIVVFVKKDDVLKILWKKEDK